jgi:hypothetical protein
MLQTRSSLIYKSFKSKLIPKLKGILRLRFSHGDGIFYSLTSGSIEHGEFSEKNPLYYFFLLFLLKFANVVLVPCLPKRLVNSVEFKLNS